MDKERLNVDERNGKLRQFENAIRAAAPELSVGDRVTVSDIGMQSGIFEAGEQFIVVDICEPGGLLSKWAGDPARTVRLWSFDELGDLKQLVVEPKFVSVVEKYERPAKKIVVKKK